MILALALICFAALIVAWMWLPASAGSESESMASDVSMATDTVEPEAA